VLSPFVAGKTNIRTTKLCREKEMDCRSGNLKSVIGIGGLPTPISARKGGGGSVKEAASTQNRKPE